MQEKQLRRNLGRLLQAGLVESDGARVVACLDRMQQVDDGGDADSESAAYFRRGRLVDMPQSPEVRRRVLAEIAGASTPVAATASLRSTRSCARCTTTT